MDDGKSLFETLERDLPDLVKALGFSQAPIETADGVLVVLFSKEPFTEEELAELKKLKISELRLLLRISGCREYDLKERRAS